MTTFVLRPLVTGKMAALLVFLSFALLFSEQGVCGTEIRGINPNKKSLYKSGKDFTCLDGSATVPFSYVNDDYCDCK